MGERNVLHGEREETWVTGGANSLFMPQSSMQVHPALLCSVHMPLICHLCCVYLTKEKCTYYRCGFNSVAIQDVKDIGQVAVNV